MRHQPRTERSDGVDRRTFLGGICLSPALGLELVGASEAAAENDRKTKSQAPAAIDFSRSFIYYEPKSQPIWVRIHQQDRCRRH